MTFLFPAFLAGLAALLLPWLLHRFNRETPPETPFPSTQFLEATRVPVSRKKRLKHLGLFSLRALLLLALCLLFAQPYCTNPANRIVSERNAWVVIDRSASMQADSVWSSAQAEAARVLADTQSSFGANSSSGSGSGSGARAGANAGANANASSSANANDGADAGSNSTASSNRESSASLSASEGNSLGLGATYVQLFDMSSTLTAHGERSRELSAANATLRSLSPSFEHANYGVMMQQLDALAAKQSEPVDVIFITDAQKSGLPLQPRQLRTNNIRQFIVRTVGPAASNIAIRGRATSTDGINASVNAQILWTTADSLNTSDGAGDISTNRTPITAEINIVSDGAESPLHSERINLTDNTPVSITIDNLILPTVDTRQITLNIGRISIDASTETSTNTSTNTTSDTSTDSSFSDTLEFDNQLDLPVQTLSPTVVRFRSFGVKTPEESALFLRTALATDGLARVVNDTPSNDGALDSAKHWVAFIPATESGTITLPTEVQTFVANGGNVLAVLQETNEVSAAELVESDYVGSRDAAHPLALGDVDWQNVNLYAQLPLTLETTDRTLMRSGQGAPLLVERTLTPEASQLESVKVGRVLIVNDPLDGKASDLPFQPAFVEWVTRWVQWFDANSAFPAEVNLGDSISLPSNAQVVSPSGKALRSLSETNTRNQLLITEPGIHTIVTETTEHQLAAVVPWAESNVARLDAEFVSSWVSGELNGGDNSDALVNSDNDSSQDAEPTVVSSETEVPNEALENEEKSLLSARWWPWLLALLALTLMAESLLANRRLSVRRDGWS